MKSSWKPAKRTVLDKSSREWKILNFLASAMNLVEQGSFTYHVEDTSLGTGEGLWTTIVRRNVLTGDEELMFSPTSQEQFCGESEMAIRLLADKVVSIFNMTEPCLGEVEEMFNQ